MAGFLSACCTAIAKDDTVKHGSKIQIYILAGQSNMEGGGRLDAPLETDQKVDGKVQIWDGCSFWEKCQAYPGSWISLVEMQERRKTCSHNAIGPEFGFARELSNHIPAEKIHLIKVACSGTTIDSWLPASGSVPKRRHWFPRLVAHIDEALKALTEPYEIAGILWMQGESDAKTQEDAEAYQEKLQQLVSTLRTSLGKQNTAVIVGRLSSHIVKSEKYAMPFVSTVQSAQDAVAGNDDAIVVINTDDLSQRPDLVHFDVTRQMKLGERFAKAMLELQGISTACAQVHTPLDPAQPWSIRMIESEMLRFPEAWQIDWNKRPQWDYVHGLNLLAIAEVYRKTHDPRMLSYIKGYYDMLVQEDGSISTYDIHTYNLDMINPGKVLFFLYDETGNPKYRKAADLLRSQLRTHPRTEQGGFWHKKRYPDQMWLDGLYMGAPFYAEYIVRYGDMRELDDVFLQFELIEEYLYDTGSGLPRHGWDAARKQPWADKETGLSPHHWTRSLGWYAMAMIDVLAVVPGDHPKTQWLRERFQTFIDAALRYQRASGIWYQVPDLGGRNGNYLEASGTAMLTYAIAKGVSLKVLPDTYRHHAEKGFAGLIDHMISVDPESNVISLEQVCAVAGLGGRPYRDGSFDYYISEPVRANDAKGIGPFILAAHYLSK